MGYNTHKSSALKNIAFVREDFTSINFQFCALVQFKVVGYMRLEFILTYCARDMYNASNWFVVSTYDFFKVV